ncbi:MAG: hypothetical protein IJC56_05115 [Clostridia bacterium]|nr:hypothetical protein [Clostridia bacterium]
MNRIIAIVVAVMIITVSGAFASGTVNQRYTNEVIRQVNAERSKYGVSMLYVDGELSRAAYIRALELTKRFSHTRPDGSMWSTVTAKAKGENIALGYGYPDKVMAAWLTSAGHRRNILKSGYGSIGVCALEYNGIIYWVQLFGK